MDFKERYKYNPVTDFLGKGGFARVYKAEDMLLKRIVALKFFTQSGDGKHTLIQEISRAIALTNENLCRYYDAALISSVNIHGEVDNIEVGVIEYIDGGELKAFLASYPEQLDKLLTDVLHGLAFLHRKGIIHRDLKPQNILVKTLDEPEPVAKITDFGISKEVNGSSGESSKLMGTIEYMAPEQFNPEKYGMNGKIGTNLDLWSFGLLLYELLTGEKLFGNKAGDTNPTQIMMNILNEDLINERVNKLKDPYKTIIKRCLVKDAAQRVQKAEELIILFNTTLAAETPINPGTKVITKFQADAVIEPVCSEPAPTAVPGVPIESTVIKPEALIKSPKIETSNDSIELNDGGTVDWSHLNKNNGAGEKNKTDNEPESKKWMIIGGLILAIIIVAAFMTLYNPQKNKNHTEQGPLRSESKSQTKPIIVKNDHNSTVSNKSREEGKIADSIKLTKPLDIKKSVRHFKRNQTDSDYLKRPETQTIP